MLATIRISVLLILLGMASSAQAQVQVSRFSAYQKNFPGKYSGQENVSADNGGYYTLMLYNAGTSAASISQVDFVFNSTTYQPTAWYCTSENIAPQTYATLFVKAQGPPFRENDNNRIRIVSTSGTVQADLQNKTPMLRFSAIVPDTANRLLWIYLRNMDTAAFTLDSLFLDGMVYGNELSSWIVGQNRTIKGKELAILKVPFTDHTFLKNIYAGIAFRSGSTTLYNSASVRLLPPKFTWGTWHSSSFDPDKEQARKDFRMLRITTVHGPGNYSLMQQAYDDYFLEVIKEANFSRNDSFNTAPAIADINALKDKDFLNAWTIDDEPDLNGKDIGEQVVKANTYRKYDLNTPVHVNLAVSKKYCRYGWYADIVGMDHYAAPPAPNIINLRWVPIVGQPGELYEALDYTESLKWNAEPRRIWTWVQHAPGPWSYAEDDFALNIQFWMHIFGGAKSIKYFVQQSHTRSEYPELWNEANRLLKQFSPIEHLIGFAEPSGLVKSNTIKCVARALVSDKYMLVGAMNNTVTYAWNGDFANIRYNASIQSTAYQLEVTIPEWIATPTCWMILPDGRSRNVTLQSLGGNKYRIVSPENLYKQCHVFLIGVADTQAPVSPVKLQAVDVQDNEDYTLSWNFGADDLGVAGYVLKLNGQLVDTVYGQVYEVDGLDLNCPTANWEVRAFDLFRNVSTTAATLTMPYDISILPVAVDGSSASATYALNDTVQLFVSVSGNAGLRIWQVSGDSLIWTAYSAGATTVRLTTDSLVFKAATPGIQYFRQQITDGCGNTFYSPVVKITVSVPTSVRNNNSFQASIFPNPGKGKFMLQWNMPERVRSVEVFDEQDKRVRTFGELASPAELDLQGLPAGLYYVVVRSENKQAVSKLVIVK